MRFSVGNISGRPLSIDGLNLAEGERIDNLENVSDEVRSAADRGEVMIIETPRAEDPQGLNRIPAPSAASPTPVEAASNDGVIHNPTNGDPNDLQASGLRRDPAGAKVDPARADVSISDPNVPGSVSAAESKQPISSHSDLEPGSNASPASQTVSNEAVLNDAGPVSISPAKPVSPAAETSTLPASSNTSLSDKIAADNAAEAERAATASADAPGTDAPKAKK